MNHDDLPQRWTTKLQEYLLGLGVERGRLSVEEFHHHLKLTFQDESFAFFYYAFYLEDAALKEVAVFTEHCGYTSFPYQGRGLSSLNLSGPMKARMTPSRIDQRQRSAYLQLRGRTIRWTGARLAGSSFARLG
jgi:hypothetical protein